MNRKGFIGVSVVIALCLLILSGLSWRVQAGAPRKEGPPNLKFNADHYYGPEEYYGSDSTPSDMATQTDLTVTVPPSKLTYQSYQDNNWEIFLAEGDGSNATRLTWSQATDIHPRLNRGCTKIAFASRWAGEYEIYTMNLDGSAVTALTSNDKDDVNPVWSPDGTKIAYQSYQDGQAEIYTMNADGSGQTRLTWDGSYDGEPSWSPEGDKIAFTSTRPGYASIWVMGIDGSEVKQLTGPIYSDSPTWSPDGSQIAYQGYWDSGPWGLMVMNADGTDQRLVYSISTGDIVEIWPNSWSPDGRYIAFTQIYFINYGGTWYWIAAFLLYHDLATGSCSNPIIAGGVEWYPDVQTLDNIPPISSIQSLAPESPATFKVSWSGSDGSGSGLKTFDIQVKDGETGIWTPWMQATGFSSATYQGLAGHTYYFRSRARDFHGNLEAWPINPEAYTRVETRQPVGAIHVSKYLRNNSLLFWEGVDPGGSEILKYDLQYTDLANNQWIDWLTGTDHQAALFHGTLEHTYHFRVRAMDQALNVGGWYTTSNPTTLCNWAIQGTIRNHAGFPVTLATITVTPSGGLTTDSEGNYQVCVLSDANKYSINWEKLGYGVLPLTTYSKNQDVSTDVIFPPANNLIPNEGFENGSLGSSWISGGNIAPTITNTIFHTGMYSAVIGAPGKDISPRQKISSTDLAQDKPQLYLSEYGSVHVFWGTASPLTAKIIYTTRNRYGSWSLPEPIVSSNQFTRAEKPHLVQDPDGNIYVSWVYKGHYSVYRSINYIKRSNDGIWHSPQEIPGTAKDNEVNTPVLEISSNGDMLIAWEEETNNGYNLYYSSQKANEFWHYPTLLLKEKDFGQLQLLIGTDDRGSFNMIWLEYPTSQGKVMYARREANSGWSIFDQLWITNLWMGMDLIYQPKLIMEEEGIVHVGWNFKTDSIYTVGDLNGSWSPPEAIPNFYGCGNLAISKLGRVYSVGISEGKSLQYTFKETNGNWQQPAEIYYSSGGIGACSFALDPAGYLHIVFSTGTTQFQNEIFYTKEDMDGTWLNPKNISNSTNSYSRNPEITIENNGQPHILWVERLSRDWWVPVDVYYAGQDLAGQDYVSSLSHSLTLPLTMTKPILSYMVWFNTDSSEGESQFQVEVDDGTTSTIVKTIRYDTDGWSHQWVDLTAWSGQNITVHFSVFGKAGYPKAWAYLDEVTVGSTPVDTWATGHPANFLPGETVEYAIAYGNQGGADASNVVLTHTLPSELTFISASVPMTPTGSTLVWNLGDLPANADPQTIYVTATLSPDATLEDTLTGNLEIATDSTELEVANNVTQIKFFIGRKLFLPLIHRQ